MNPQVSLSCADSKCPAEVSVSSAAVSLLQVETDLTLSALSDETFDRQITKDLILEDTLRFLLSSHTHLSSHTDGRQVRQQ